MTRWTLFTDQGPQRLHAAPDALPPRHTESGQTKAFLWLDTDLDEPLNWLAEVTRLTGQTLDEMHLEDLNNPLHPSHHDRADHYSRTIVRTLTNRPIFDDEHRLTIKTRPAYFLLFDRLLVTQRAKDSRTFCSAIDHLNQPNCTHPDQVEQFLTFRKFPESPDELMSQLLSNLIDRFLAIRVELSDRLERWQRDLLSPRKKFEDWTTLLAVRAELNKLESLAEDHYDAVRDWEEDLRKHHRPSQAVQVNLRDTLDHIRRVVKLADRLGANTEAAVQLHFSATAHKTNEIVTVLTMLTAVFMPLTLITGVFGMNFQSMPWIESGWGFWACMGLMGASLLSSVALMLLIRGRRHVKR